MTEATNLAEALPKECARVRVVLGHYKGIGSAGAFGALMIEQDLQLADRAMASGDVVEMMRAYQTLKEIEG